MAKISLSLLFLFILVSGLSLARRTEARSLRNVNTTVIAADTADDGICSSIVEKQGYTCEEHSVTTQDGYVLGMHRIPVGMSGSPPSANRPPVLIQHGVLVDGNSWLLLPPKQSLAFLLADNEFDVWIANSRGTKFSRQHTTLSTNSSDYWNWSWDELVAYELPAIFKYVNDQTGQALHYVGHSQAISCKDIPPGNSYIGTLMALAAFSKNQLVNMVKSAALLSPIAYLGNMTSPLGRRAAWNFVAESVLSLGIYEFNPKAPRNPFRNFVKELCISPGIDCTNIVSTFTGPNCCLSPSIVGKFMDHEPQAIATKDFVHLSQMVRKGTITMFDYENKEENTRHYGQSTPPVYDMSKIPKDLPLFIGYGGADALADVRDVQLLLKDLKDHDKDKLVLNYRDNYAHLDFVFGESAKQDVYDPIISFFRLH